jgi:polyphosphate kinase 2 (PPK2 family)
MNFAKEMRVRPGKRVKLSHYDAANTFGYEKGADCKKLTEKALARLDAQQELLYADNKRAVLIVLQGMDAAGKDGTIRHVMSGVNPQGCSVTQFKVPSHIEAQHDFLWRAHLAVPGRGQIGIFNRSYYEDVLVVRVHKSKDEQKRRFEERLKDPSHQWKLSPADLAERKFWDDYVEAYEAALTKCNTADAPWHIIPANHKWFRNLAVSRIIAGTLEGFHSKYPKPSFDFSHYKLK